MAGQPKPISGSDHCFLRHAAAPQNGTPICSFWQRLRPVNHLIPPLAPALEELRALEHVRVLELKVAVGGEPCDQIGSNIPSR